MEIREVILHAFYRRVKLKEMEIEKVPIPYQKPLQELLEVSEVSKNNEKNDYLL